MLFSIHMGEGRKGMKKYGIMTQKSYFPKKIEPSFNVETYNCCKTCLCSLLSPTHLPGEEIWVSPWHPYLSLPSMIVFIKLLYIARDWSKAKVPLKIMFCFKNNWLGFFPLPPFVSPLFSILAVLHEGNVTKQKSASIQWLLILEHCWGTISWMLKVTKCTWRCHSAFYLGKLQ